MSCINKFYLTCLDKLTASSQVLKLLSLKSGILLFMAGLTGSEAQRQRGADVPQFTLTFLVYSVSHAGILCDPVFSISKQTLLFQEYAQFKKLNINLSITLFKLDLDS